MPFLDLCHLFFDPAATIESPDSIFGKEWRMTLDYILHEPGLRTAWTSHLSVEHELWAFLLWESEDARAHFYHQTHGFGLVSQRMKRVPRVFFFDDAEYGKLGETRDWTIDVLYEDLGEPVSAELLANYDFVTQHKDEAGARLYQGNDFGNAVVGLFKGDVREHPKPKDRLGREQFSIRLHKYEPIVHQSCTHTEVALNIADLTKKKPWEYGVLDYDASDYADTAYPMDLSFQPMMTIGSTDNFSSDHDHQLSVQPGDGSRYSMCIVSLTEETNGLNQVGKGVIEGLRNEVGLHDGVQGLREISLLRMNSGQSGTRAVRLLCVWNTTSDFDRWRQNYASHDHCSLDSMWTTDKLGLPNLQWENLPLTPDNQAWQAIDKIIEMVMFNFSQDLSPAEKEAFQKSVYAFTNTMSSCWSGEIDARPVVYAEDPIWNEAHDGLSSCLLFLAWDGIEQRAAWLRNFMANGFSLTGHLAHRLGQLCPGVKSDTYSWEKMYECHVTHEASANVEGGGDTDDESDRDMGF